ncbi:MAG: hypothetical protein Tsb0013_03120 [Phycisphaerales bacterium]
MITHKETTVWIQDRLNLIASGEDHTLVRHELLDRASRRIRHLVVSAMRARPALGRWEQDDDVLQEVLIRLDRAVRDAKPANPGQFFVIVAQHVRWATLDLLRHHLGARGHALVHKTGVFTSELAEAKGERSASAIEIDLYSLHRAVDRLPEEERDAWHLVVYLDLTHDQAAEQLGVSSKTVQRRVRSAKMRLASELDQFAPGAG